MASTSIEWTNFSWNPIVGCSVLSPGCTNCYAMAMAARLDRMGQPRYAGLTKPAKAGPVWTGEVRFVEEVLTAPLKRRKPTKYFVNSMSDLFHEGVSFEWIDRIFAVMALAPQHSFQVLTKRADRMRSYMTTRYRKSMIAEQVMCISELLAREAGSHEGRIKLDHFSRSFAGAGPFPNVWLGVSVEDQRRADERIPDLLATPAAVRWISAEPLLGPVDLERIPVPDDEAGKYAGHGFTFNALRRVDDLTLFEAPAHLDWVVVGGESGPGARPMRPDWARSLRDQCAAADVPYYFKQWGEYHTAALNMMTGDPVFREFTNFQHWVNKAPTWVKGGVCLDTTGRLLRNGADFMRARDEGAFPVTIMHRVGKKAAGRLLDGTLHDAFPSL